ncbi:MAG: GNAT family N-acetyltransferase [Planctomycetaceae bacterium]|nr:GNAT family N-acetyltransferase [Planctomycetaceae bacterium]
MSASHTSSRSELRRRSQNLRVRVRPFAQLDAEDFAAWQRLEDKCRNGNPFLSAEFVQSATTHLGERAPLVLDICDGRDHIGLGLFDAVRHTKYLPLPHLVGWRTGHTFLDGLLLHEDREHEAAHAVAEYMQSGTHAWHGIEFQTAAVDSPGMGTLTDVLQQAGNAVWQGRGLQRAALVPSTAGPERLLTSVSIPRARSLRKGWKELEKRGPVSFEIVDAAECSPEQIDAAANQFLELEAAGWKAECGSAMKSSSEQLAFFQDLTRMLGQRGKLFFSQLCVGDEVVGSVVHLVSGREAFAFKLGWNPEFERGCPGFQLKARMVCEAAQQLGHLDLIDSCSQTDSFIERIWPDRRSIASWVCATSLPGKAALRVTQGLKMAKDYLVTNFRQLQGGGR